MLSNFNTRRDSIIEKLKRVKYRDLRDMVYILQLTYNEVVDILDVNYIAGSTKGYNLASGMYEITDNNLMLKSLPS